MHSDSARTPVAAPRWKCVGLLVVLVAWSPHPSLGADGSPAPAAKSVDAQTLHQKVLCGYQGWFRCPGDGTDEGWLHWSRNQSRLSPRSITVEMWPDMSEYSEQERYLAPGFAAPDGRPAYLFSSANQATVERHFRWMEEYGIDGVFLQRFLVNLRKASFDTVLDHVRSSAAKSGRAYAICYDLTGASRRRLYDLLADDWRRLIDEEQVTRDERYLHHDGKPVVFVWGLDSQALDAAFAHRIIDLFKADDRYSATLIGGCPWPWRREPDAEWARAYRRLDVISPWNIGNYTMVDGQKVAATRTWRGDLAEARRNGMDYMPVIYPGFGWTNIKGGDAARATIPRQGGEFYWRQFLAAADLGIDMAYVAMFDEVDEATAIFKVSSTPPAQAYFETYEGLPSDWYLRLTGEGSKVIRGERIGEAALPIRP